MLKLKHLDGALRHEQLLERAAWKAANGGGMAERATIGDVVACDVRHPYPQTLRLKLDTQAAADHANTLLTLEPQVWRLEKLVDQPRAA